MKGIPLSMYLLYAIQLVKKTLLQKPKVGHNTNRSLLIDPILNQLNPVHNFTDFLSSLLSSELRVEILTNQRLWGFQKIKICCIHILMSEFLLVSLNRLILIEIIFLGEEWEWVRKLSYA